MFYMPAMLLTCVSLLVAGGWLATRSPRQSRTTMECAAGLLIVLGLVLLGYRLHHITAM